MTRVSWDEYFMNMAEVVSSRSSCHTQVGAVIIHPVTKYIVATGFNGVPTGVTPCAQLDGCLRVLRNIPSGSDYTHNCRALHAENNAVLQAGIRNCQGMRMYVFGQPVVCPLCTRVVVQAGIVEVVLKANKDAEVQILALDALRAGI